MSYLASLTLLINKLDKLKASKERKLQIERDQILKLSKELDIERETNERLQKELYNLQEFGERSMHSPRILNSSHSNEEYENLKANLYDLNNENNSLKSRLMHLTTEKGRLRTQYERMHREMEDYKQKDRIQEENKSLQTVRRILKYLKEQIGDLEYRENEIKCKYRSDRKMGICKKVF